MSTNFLNSDSSWIERFKYFVEIMVITNSTLRDSNEKEKVTIGQ